MLNDRARVVAAARERRSGIRQPAAHDRGHRGPDPRQTRHCHHDQVLASGSGVHPHDPPVRGCGESLSRHSTLGMLSHSRLRTTTTLAGGALRTITRTTTINRQTRCHPNRGRSNATFAWLLQAASRIAAAPLHQASLSSQGELRCRRCGTFQTATAAAGTATKHGMTAEVIERHYGTVLDGSGASMATRLARFEAEQNRDAARPMTEAPWSFGQRLGHAIEAGPLESPTART